MHLERLWNDATTPDNICPVPYRPVQRDILMQWMGVKVVVCQFLGSICHGLLELNFLLVMCWQCAHFTLGHIVTLAHNVTTHAKSNPD
jgi:hypothetical protein